MASDRSLAALLRSLQSPSVGEAEVARLLGTATGLLTLLSNPLNVTLLTSQLLTAPAIWRGISPLRAGFQLLGVFNTASIHLVQRDRERESGTSPYGSEGLPIEQWTKSVVKGADDKSPRWKHLLILGGVLVGFEQHQAGILSYDLRHNLETAVVTATNLALGSTGQEATDEAYHVICFVLGHVFDLLSGYEKLRLDHERLLPCLVESTFFSKDGLHSGYFVGTMDSDLVQGQQNKFSWSAKSGTYFQAQRIASSPLVAALGTLSRLMAFCVEAVPRAELVFETAAALQRFSRTVSVQWQQNKLSEVDPSEESLFLDEETLSKTIPTLWHLLKSALFATMIIQSAMIARLVSDNRMPAKDAPFLAIQTLHTLRNLYFITYRLGQQLFSQHTFVYTGSIDILTKYPVQAEAFLREIAPSEFGRIPGHPYARLLDLFFLNTAEHFTLDLPVEANRDLLLGAASAYTGTGQDARLIDIFEAAHSVTLAVFSAPQNFSLTIEALPLYIDTLFQVFPSSLSARQFRLAIRTLVYITSTPGPILASQPLLGSTLMELVYTRALHAPDTILPTLPRTQPVTEAEEPALSEQSALVLTLIDALPALSLPALEEWLPLVAEALNAVRDARRRRACRQRFWDVLANGEMDVARAQRCVAWWTTRGGREAVLYGTPNTALPLAGDALPHPAAVGQYHASGDSSADDAEPLMSGALPGLPQEPREEKL